MPRMELHRLGQRQVSAKSRNAIDQTGLKMRKNQRVIGITTASKSRVAVIEAKRCEGRLDQQEP
jgi:phage terminase large subunit-like protein